MSDFVYRSLIKLVVTLVLFSGSVAYADSLLVLTVEKIMRDPAWIGSSPSGVAWSEDSRRIYFDWNPENADDDSLYVVDRAGGKPEKVSAVKRSAIVPNRGDYDRHYRRKVYEKNGDIFVLDIKSARVTQVTNTLAHESSPHFLAEEEKLYFRCDDNLFLWDADDGCLAQLTDFREGKEDAKDRNDGSAQEIWLERQQADLFPTLVKRKEKRENRQEARTEEEPNRPRPIYIGDQELSRLKLDPTGRFVSFQLEAKNSEQPATEILAFVTESGFTENLRGRSKVGESQSECCFGIYDLTRDSIYYLSPDSIPGIYDQPAYLADYAATATDSSEQLSEQTEPKPRPVTYHGPFWSDDGAHAMMVILSQDNKDRWIMSLDAESGRLTLVDRQHDEAWIGGPGIWGWHSAGSVGWLPDNRRFWFQSEATGYSHLYTFDVVSGDKTQLTSGQFEVRGIQVSRDGQRFYFTSNELDPGERQLYSMSSDGGKSTRITSVSGGNRVTLSPDERTLAILYSSANRPGELFVQPNKPGAKMIQVTHSCSDEFLSYPWRVPEIVTFTASDGATVYARLYQPLKPQINGPAVVFVHGAGYMQSVHHRWSWYFREFMFNNLLADRGYTVLDIDYRGSAGYGRDWRTGIYRHMGGLDLSDQVDGVAFLVEEYQVDSQRVGLYGGSYGGFLTLMALFTEPEVFAAGAALRSVTDWAHYNHGYTANILNTPATDSIAYARSSPINFAEGFAGALLMCHGMVDANVQFQDVVRLSQRLVYLGKENWELAVYPVEAHSFKEESSWTDEYRRILKLFEQNLK